MKTLVLLAVAAGSLLSGCVAVPVDDGRGYYRDDGRAHYRDDGRSYSRDRDRDGVPNSQDRRPDDPRRY